MGISRSDPNEIFLHLAYLNPLVKSFPKRYDTSRGLLIQPSMASASVCAGSKCDVLQTSLGYSGNDLHLITFSSDDAVCVCIPNTMVAVNFNWMRFVAGLPGSLRCSRNGLAQELRL